jgi:hypothetical protein
MKLAAWLLKAALMMAPPGQTSFSVAPVVECAGAAKCEGAKPSKFYGTWVRQETAEQGRARYEMITRELAAEAEAQAVKPWTPRSLSAMALGIAVLESGLREDVQVGRGWAKLASEDGGMGRGPGKEVSFPQIHPSVAARFLDPGEKLEDLLGTDPAAVRRAWRTQLRMLIHARKYCAYANVPGGLDWDFSTISLYGTGTSCGSINGGKTRKRVNAFRSIMGIPRT